MDSTQHKCNKQGVETDREKNSKKLSEVRQTQPTNQEKQRKL
jgi:hypothetical protein